MSDEILNAEIQAVINKALPAQTAGALRKALEQALDDKTALGIAKADLLRAEVDVGTLKTELTEKADLYNKAVTMTANATAASDEAATKEREMAVTLAQMELKQEREKVTLMQDLVSKVFGSNRFSYTVDASGTRNWHEHGINNYCNDCGSPKDRNGEETTVDKKTISGDVT